MQWRGLVCLSADAGCAAIFSFTQRDDATNDSVAGRRDMVPAVSILLVMVEVIEENEQH